MKNRRFALLILAMLLVTCFTIPSFAAVRYVRDTAGILTGAELARLEERAAAISEQYDFGVYIRILKDFRTESSYTNIEKYTMDLYDSDGLGKGDSFAGTILVLSMAERDYNLDFNSSRADYAFTAAGRDWMENRFLPYFGREDYYGGFSEYLNTCEEYLEAAHAGTPVGEHESDTSDGIGFFAVIPGLIAAIVVGVILCVPMRTAGQKHDANAYIVHGSMQLHRRSDMFLHRSVSRTPRQTQPSSSGSSGSHHYSSGSHSGRSGKF